MPNLARILTLVLATVVILSLALFATDPPAPGHNTDPTYQQLRGLTLSGESVGVNNLILHRDAATFHLRSGALCFVAPVAGKVTGAVFVGDGIFVLDPRAASEIASLKLLTKGTEFVETFGQAVFRFTDSSYEELKKASGTTAGGCDAGLLKDSQNTTRHKLYENLESRLLQDVLGSEPGGLFVAFIHGKRYNSKELFTIDPHSSSDQVELMTYDDNKSGIWAGFGISEASQRPDSRNLIHIDHQQLDTTIEKNAHLTGKASTTFLSLVNGLRVIPFNLFPTLRVENAIGEGGQVLSFVQEDPDTNSILLANFLHCPAGWFLA